MNEEKKYPSDLQDRFQVRLPAGMRGKIKELADQSGRSMNAEIVHRLSESIELSERLEKIKQKEPVNLIDPVALTKDKALKELKLNTAIMLQQAATMLNQIAEQDPECIKNLPDPPAALLHERHKKPNNK